MLTSDPFEKIYHMAGKIGSGGQVSAVCFTKPHAIDMAKAGWALEWRRVTCRKCLARKPHGAVSVWDEAKGA